MESEAKEVIKGIIESQGHGLPRCPESIHQSDWWNECATTILEEICSTFDLYAEPEE